MGIPINLPSVSNKEEIYNGRRSPDIDTALILKSAATRTVSEIRRGNMNTTSVPSSAVTMALVLWAAAAMGQAVHVSADHGAVTLSVSAQKAYALTASSHAKAPVLSISCQEKGKKFSHTITFSPGGLLTEQQYSTFGGAASLELQVTAGEQKLATHWVAHGSLENFAYLGKTEPERLNFLQVLLGTPMISIEFTPFLTGEPVTSTFDLTGLRAEFDKHPECTSK
jgi:hypothetical protein